MRSQIGHERWKCVDGDKTRSYDTAQAWLIFTLYAALPIILMTIIYCTVFMTLKHRLRVLSGEHNAAARLRRVRQNRHTMLLLVTVLAAYVVFTVPDKVRWLLPTIWQVERNPKQERLFESICLITEAMYPFHVAVNPFIYTACDRNFRARVGEIFRRFAEKGRENSQTHRQFVARFLYRFFGCLYGYKLKRYETGQPVTFSTKLRSSTKITILQESPSLTPVRQRSENTTAL